MPKPHITDLFGPPRQTPAGGFERDRSGFFLPSGLIPPRHPAAIDLFSGAGGFGLGIHMAGFEVVAAVELDTWAAMTYLRNLADPAVRVFVEEGRENKLRRELESQVPKAQRRKNPDVLWTQRSQFGQGWIKHHPEGPPGCKSFFIQDVRTLTGQQILDSIGMKRGEVALVTGGPPCQGFSKAGQREVMDPRNSLVFDFARLVIEIQPKAFVMENVEGILSMVTPEGVPVVDAFCRMMEEGGMGVFSDLREMINEQGHEQSIGLRQSNSAEPDLKADEGLFIS